MEKIICSSCGATLIPNSTSPFLTCDYCDTTVPNTWYDEATAKATAEPTLGEICIKTLKEMGEEEKLASVNESCFGTPLYIAESIRTTLDVPQQENVYLLYDRFSIIGNFTEGFVLADTGMYYRHDGETGRRSWEAFVTGAISGTGDPGLLANGTLSVGKELTFAVASNDDARIAQFVIALHNRLYLAHTGQNAPESWRFLSAEEAEAAARTTDAWPTTTSTGKTSSVTRTVLGTAATLLAGGSILSGARRTASTVLHPQRHTRPVSQPVVPTQPARKAPVRPGMNLRPGAGHPGTINRPDAGRPAMPVRPSTNARPALNRPGNNRPGMNDRPGMGGPGGRGGRGGSGGPGGRGRR